MLQPVVTSPRRASENREKFEPGVQEIRLKFAHIKRELRHIQRMVAAQSPKSPLPSAKS